MRAGRLPENDPLEQQARAELAAKQGEKPEPPLPDPKQWPETTKPHRWS